MSVNSTVASTRSSSDLRRSTGRANALDLVERRVAVAQPGSSGRRRELDELRSGDPLGEVSSALDRVDRDRRVGAATSVGHLDRSARTPRTSMSHRASDRARAPAGRGAVAMHSATHRRMSGRASAREVRSISMIRPVHPVPQSSADLVEESSRLLSVATPRVVRCPMRPRVASRPRARAPTTRSGMGRREQRARACRLRRSPRSTAPLGSCGVQHGADVVHARLEVGGVPGDAVRQPGAALVEDDQARERAQPLEEPCALRGRPRRARRSPSQPGRVDEIDRALAERPGRRC